MAQYQNVSLIDPILDQFHSHVIFRHMRAHEEGSAAGGFAKIPRVYQFPFSPPVPAVAAA
jgi:hypothetical protein